MFDAIIPNDFLKHFYTLVSKHFFLFPQNTLLFFVFQFVMLSMNSVPFLSPSLARHDTTSVLFAKCHCDLK